MEYNTQILPNDAASVLKAAEFLKSGEIVAIPTETVYGLAANAYDERAVAKIFIAKGRPQDNPLIVHIASLDMIDGIAREIPKLAYKCAELFWPGPLTMIMPKSDKIPLATSGGLDTVGVRFPSNRIVQAVIKACGFPLAAPSANLSGSPSPTTARHVYNDMNGRIPCIIDDGACCVGVESTVITFEGDCIRLLRPGFISVNDLMEVTENVTVDKGVTEVVANDAKVASPGMKYKHYSPKAEVIIIDSDDKAFEEYVSRHKSDGLYCMTFEKREVCGVPALPYGRTDEEQARRLFDVLREFDNFAARKVYAKCPKKDGVGLAVYNRLLRAAAFRVVKL